MRRKKIALFLSILLTSAALTVVPFKPVMAFETPAGLEAQYQQILSQHQDALLPAFIPFDYESASVNVLDSYYSLFLQIEIEEPVVIGVSISGRYGINPAQTMNALQTFGVEQITLSNQVIGYLSPPGETDEEAPHLTFFINTTEFFLSGWVDPNDLVTLANSMIENQ